MTKQEAEAVVKIAAAERDRTKTELLIARRAAEIADSDLNQALSELGRVSKS